MKGKETVKHIPRAEEIPACPPFPGAPLKYHSSHVGTKF